MPPSQTASQSRPSPRQSGAVSHEIKYDGGGTGKKNGSVGPLMSGERGNETPSAANCGGGGGSAGRRRRNNKHPKPPPPQPHPEAVMAEGGGGVQNSAIVTPSPVKVLPPENESGPVEYKRRIHRPTPNRLRTLATQMSYRLDEGGGVATYQIGVEDDGMHSLLDYGAMKESANVLELLARSLNAVVVERKFIQHECGGGGGEYAKDTACDGTGGGPAADTAKRLSVGAEDKEEKDGTVGEGVDGGRIPPDERPGVPTRCELTVQRVETHLLDPSPTSLAAIAAAASSSSVTVSETTTVTETMTDAASGTTTRSESTDSTAKRTLRTPTGGNVATSHCSTSSTTTSPTASKNKATTSASSVPSTQPPPDSVSETLSTRNIRVAVVGNVDAGKSTLIGTLTTSSLDDGRGRSRTSIMKHRHEIESGRTSTATTHLLGFRSTGETVAGSDRIRAPHRARSEDEVARESHRVVTLMDLAGHEKYLKTTIHGVSSGFADYALILVNGRHPPTHMTQHHVNLCCSFGIPLVVVFTKIDGCPEHALKISRGEVTRMLRSPDVGKRPFSVRNVEDVDTCLEKMHTLAPMFETSCVTGEGLDLLKRMLFRLPKRRRHEKKLTRPFEFLVEDIFNVPGVGAVVSGFVNAGELTVGSGANVFVGPVDDGTFLRTIAKSAHIARINTSHITAGQGACLALALNKDMRKKLRRGMVVLRDGPTSTRHFDAEICVLKGEGTTIRRSYQAYVHILNVRQSAYARHIELLKSGALLPGHGHAHDDDEEGIVLRPGSRARVRFEFAKRPEYIRPGMRMLFRDGRVRGVGIITAIPDTVAPVS